jgi:hypothetical protein
LSVTGCAAHAERPPLHLLDGGLLVGDRLDVELEGTHMSARIAPKALRIAKADLTEAIEAQLLAR